MASILSVGTSLVWLLVSSGPTDSLSLANPEAAVDSSGVARTAAAEPAPVPPSPSNFGDRTGFVARHPAVALSLLLGAVLAVDALLASAAYEDDKGRTLAGVDGGCVALMLVTPSEYSSPAQTIASAGWTLALAGVVLAAGSNGASPDQLFVTNMVGIPVATMLGFLTGSWFDRRRARR